MAIIVLAAAAAGVMQAGCGEDVPRQHACTRAVELWNSCASADRQSVFGVPKLEWNGPCQDGVDFVIDTGNTVKVDLASWADAYTACQARGDVMPFTCMCPGLAFLVPNYTPPASCSEFSPQGVADVCQAFNESYQATTP